MRAQLIEIGRAIFEVPAGAPRSTWNVTRR